MNTTPALPVRGHNRYWLVALLLAFVAGFALAWWLLHQKSFVKPLCPVPTPAASTASADAAGGAMRGGGTPAAGSPTKLGVGDGAGAGNIPPGASTAPDVDGTPPNGGSSDNGDPPGGSLGGGASVASNPGSGVGKPSDGGLDVDAGGGKGKSPGDDDSVPSSSASMRAAPEAPSPATSSGGTLHLGESASGAADTTKSKPNGKILTAADYRYDKSGLPHYPNAVKVASGTEAAAAAVAGSDAKDFSITEILTDDTPDVVADWYQKSLPSGWQRISMPSAEAMTQATAQAKTPQPGELPVDGLLRQTILAPQIERSTPGIDAARAAGLTMFQPADPGSDQRMILVIKDSKTGKTGILLMKKAAQS